VFKAGEESKNLTTYANICKELITFGLQRQDAIVAVGGGVCTDIAGFCAATYMRGVDFYSVPTTTLAAADASVGGKTALDFLGNKNIIGAFLQPKGVLIDTATFMTLDKRQFRSGLVEIIKMAATSDAELFSDIENGLIEKDLTSAIKRGLMIKKAVVEADECETGLRRILNFGHTLGHGIESLGGLTHGECVALGMLPMCSAEVRERLINVLSGVGISTKAPEDIKNTFDFIKADKKASGDEIYTVFVDTIGDGKIEKISFSDLFCRIRNFK
jgi:3-dehydroquinate synthase